MQLHDLDLVGYGDIAIRLHVHRRTPYIWRQKGILPTPDAIVNEATVPTPVWLWSTILQWLRDTDRTHLLLGK